MANGSLRVTQEVPIWGDRFSKRTMVDRKLGDPLFAGSFRFAEGSNLTRS